MSRCGIRRTGTVWYADQLQVLIKWDDGQSSSLRRSSTQQGNLVAEQPSLAAEEEITDARALAQAPRQRQSDFGEPVGVGETPQDLSRSLAQSMGR
jgi:hypothetical protein